MTVQTWLECTAIFLALGLGGWWLRKDAPRHSWSRSAALSGTLASCVTAAYSLLAAVTLYIGV